MEPIDEVSILKLNQLYASVYSGQIVQSSFRRKKRECKTHRTHDDVDVEMITIVP